MSHVANHILGQIRVLRAVIRPKRPPRRRGLPRQAQPDSARLEYFHALRAILEHARRMVERRLIPELGHILAEGRRGDSERADSKANDIMDEISKKFFEELRPKELERLAGAAAERTSEFHKEQFSKQVKAAVGVDVLRTEPSLDRRVRDFVSENVALIKSVPNKYLDEVEKRVTRAVREGATATQLATDLQYVYAMSERQARLIARDQIGKFYGEVNEARQTEMGITHYIWRTSRDERVRESHEAREGERFAWNDPPEDGHPGEPINCRCFPEPDMTPIVDALEGP